MAARDVLIIGIILFTIAIAFFVANFASHTIVNSMIGLSQINESTAAVTSLQATATASNRIDYLFLGLFIGLILGIIITGWFIGGNPIFTFIYILIMVISVVLATLFADTWQRVTSASVFGTTIANLPITNHILNWLPLYVAIIGFIGVVVMFAKPAFSPEY